MTPTTILFDKDGTLFDFHATWSGWVAGMLRDMAQGDAVLEVVLAEALGFDLATRAFDPASPVIAGTPFDIARELIPHLPDPPPLSALVAHLNATAASAPMAEAVPLATYLNGLRARGLALGVVTNDAEAPARAHLEQVGVLEAFGVVVGCDSGHGAKPAPGPVLAACRALGAEPRAAVMVGDSLHDLMAGRAAGLRTVGVLTGLAEREDLAPMADVVMADIGGLPGWLDGLASMR
ncbi:MAG: HAD family hydrolase [Pseudomonadota bacterium]